MGIGVDLYEILMAKSLNPNGVLTRLTASLAIKPTRCERSIKPMGTENANVEGVENHSSRFLTLTVGSIGVVYGDIGTSPLYALKEEVSSRPHLAIPCPPKW